jgi:hypothetical protein
MTDPTPSRSDKALGDPIEQRFRRASFSFREKADRV